MRVLNAYGLNRLSIVPWNAPIVLTLRAVAVPIICGNTVVLKTSEVSPRTQAIIVETFIEVCGVILLPALCAYGNAQAGVPKGVLNLISTNKEDSPARTSEIIGNPIIRKINVSVDVSPRSLETCSQSPFSSREATSSEDL